VRSHTIDSVEETRQADSLVFFTFPVVLRSVLKSLAKFGANFRGRVVGWFGGFFAFFLAFNQAGAVDIFKQNYTASRQ